MNTLQLVTLEDYTSYSSLIANSDLVPQNLRGKPADVMLCLQMGAEVGLSPMQALQSIALVSGKATLYGDGALAVVMASGLCENFVEKVEDGVASCRLKRKGMEEQTFTFSIDDAKTAKLWGKSGPWSLYPSRMLAMRCRGFALRSVFPDCLKGLLTREEVEDYPTEAKPKPLPPMPPAQRPSLPAAEPPKGISYEDKIGENVTLAGFPEPRAIEEPEAVEVETVTVGEVAKAATETIEVDTRPVTKAQIGKIQAAIRASGQDYEALKPHICRAYEIQSLKELERRFVDECIERIEKKGAAK